MDTFNARYLKRRSLGNYEHEELELSFVVEGEQKIKSDVAKYKKLVNDLLYSDNREEAIASATKTMEAINGNNKESSEESNKEDCNKDEGKKPKQQKKSSSKKSNLIAPSEASAETNNQNHAKQSAPAEEEMEEVESPYKANPPKLKVTQYNRTDKKHVDILTAYLDGLVGNSSWKKNPNITQFSIGLVGQDFIDSDGDIVESFEANCKKFLGMESAL